MKAFSLFIILLSMLASYAQKPVSVIFDTDIAPDYDDVGALAMLHAFADNGEARILATISSNAFETTAPTLCVINTYYNRGDIPVGVVNASTPNYNCPRFWAEKIIEKYPHTIKSNSDAWNALKLYRKILSEQPDKSVTIVSVGTLTNISNLLNSSPDEYSTLDGRQLITKKVKQLVSMAAAIDSSGTSGYEWNILGDVPAAQNVIRNWPVQIIISPFELGVEIFTGMDLIRNKAIKNSPVKDAYEISLIHDDSKNGRYSWDQTAVLAAVCGLKPYFSYRLVNMVIENDGKDSIISGTRITYLTLKQKPERLGKVIERLMMYQPLKNKDFY
jgi:inosine-uridine nucleoside N-ribohydrolase